MTQTSDRTSILSAKYISYFFSYGTLYLILRLLTLLLVVFSSCNSSVPVALISFCSSFCFHSSPLPSSSCFSPDCLPSHPLLVCLLNLFLSCYCFLFACLFGDRTCFLVSTIFRFLFFFKLQVAITSYLSYSPSSFSAFHG